MRWERVKPPVTEAGGVVVRLDAGIPHLLLTTAKSDPRLWIFPKGHVEPGETPEAAAVREVWEETGVAAIPQCYLGAMQFTHPGQVIRVEMFLLRYTGSGGEGEGRRVCWCTLDQALALLSFEEAREFLRRSRPVIESTVQPGTP
jgi:8-oxo-dGTP pyrophosphatase MutT (NUDIX family)